MKLELTKKEMEAISSILNEVEDNGAATLKETLKGNPLVKYEENDGNVAIEYDEKYCNEALKVCSSYIASLVLSAKTAYLTYKKLILGIEEAANERSIEIYKERKIAEVENA